MNDYHYRFSGIGRLYGLRALERLQKAHVCVVGVGGVGSWTVEALARTGVAQLTLVDLDEICLSNTNRQIQALTENVGRSKIEVLAERVAAINPRCQVNTRHDFFTLATAASLFDCEFSVVVDAIDQVRNKCILIDACRKRGIPIVTVGGAGGKRDPTTIRKADITRATHDTLLARVRKLLRMQYAYPRGGKCWNVPCVYSAESAVYPSPDGEVCVKPDKTSSLKLDCASGFGSATHMTGSFGFIAASSVTDIILEVDGS